MRSVFCAVALAALAGCAQLGQFTAQDAMQAAAIAQAVGDTAVVPCYQGIAAVGNAAAAATKPGIFTKIEEKRAAKQALENPACQPVYTDALASLLKAAVPGAAPFLP